ncbi:MAG: hypothetical protein IJ622_02595 [Bacteroidales bacterium]|nr:hypothetical protein [Bacteroidales bacterium]
MIAFLLKRCTFVVMENTGNDKTLRFILKDHLGSWTTITDAEGTVEQELSFDAWGNLRNPMTWSGSYSGTPMFDRGFTGHEHMTAFGLINMNGRVYDPKTSSFLSVDAYVQSPDNAQSFNRYAYCLNNPLKYTDSDGEFWHLIIGAAIGGIANLASNWGKIDTFGEGLAYFGIGAAAGALGAATGGAAAGVVGTVGFAGASLTGAASGFASGFTTGAGNAWMQGANLGQGLLAGSKAGGMSAAIGGLMSGVMGGVAAVRNEGNFLTGKGARFDVIDSSVTPNNNKKIDVGEGMEYSNEYAKKFSEMNFSDAKGVDNLYADGTIPDGYTKRGDLVINSKGKPVRGTTVYNGFGKGSNVYLYKVAFQSPERLYLTMGHEYLHCAYNYSGKSNAKYQDNGAYSWERGQAEIWKMNDVVAECDYMIKHFYSTSVDSYTPSKFGFFSINIRPQIP